VLHLRGSKEGIKNPPALLLSYRKGFTLYAQPITEAKYQTCLHEAAHALAYLEFEKRFGVIRITPGSADRLGEVTPAGEMMTQWQMAFISMAGPAAEGRMASELEAPEDIEGMSIQDLAVGSMFAGGAEDFRSAGPLGDEALVGAVTWVGLEWPSIIKVADALYLAGELAYEEVLELVS
jgi:hypothetical protein